jgi:hypothetical protein
MLALPRSVMPWCTSLFQYVNEHSFKNTNIWRHLNFRFDNEEFIKKCLICSSNKTLQMLYLDKTQLGDAGAASIGGALAYVTLSKYKYLAPPDFFGLIILSRCVCVRFAAKTRR